LGFDEGSPPSLAGDQIIGHQARHGLPHRLPSNTILSRQFQFRRKWLAGGKNTASDQSPHVSFNLVI
jgi:hypothetical protein